MSTCSFVRGVVDHAVVGGERRFQKVVKQCLVMFPAGCQRQGRARMMYDREQRTCACYEETYLHFAQIRI